MAIVETESKSVSFLEGGGEMGRLTRAKDWDRTVLGLGHPSEWPQSLRTALSIVLNSKFPMFLFWGPQLICFYNDAYRPTLGNEGKHPHILGLPGVEAWPEIWPTIKPLLDQVLAGQGAVWMEDQLIPIYRNGKIEDVYWTFSYSPINDESDKVVGVLVTCMETTEKILNLKRTEESESKFRNLVMQSPVPTALFNGPDFTIDLANNEVLKLWGKDKSIIGKKIIDALPEIREQPFIKLMEEVYTTGVTYEGKENLAYVEHEGILKPVYFNLVYKALYDTDEKIYALLCMGNDVTEQVLARRKIEELEERTRMAIDANEIGVYDLNLQTSEVIFTDLMHKIYGSNEPLPPEDYISMIHPEDIYIREEAHKQAEKTGRLQYQYRIILKDGSVRWIDSHAKIYYDKEGNAVRRLGTIQDITNKKRAEQIIQESERKFRTLSDFMPQLIWTSDAQGNLNYYNEAMYRYAGIAFHQINPSDWIKIIHRDDRIENIRAWNKAVSTGTPFLFEHRFRRHDGQYRWQLSRALPIKDNEGNIQMWVGTSTDIDELKKHEQQKDDFIKIASHELKTPVTTIKGYVQLLLNMYPDARDPMLSNALAIIDRQVSKLTKLITDLLDVTKVETGSFHLNKENFLIDELIADTSQELQTTITTHSLTLDLQSGISIHADKDRITQVLINLITNALKYSPKSDKIIISTRAFAGELIVSVRDFGIGIDPVDHERIFERFYRVQGKEEKTYPGFGIGLFIVKEIISLHNGKLWVESQRNNGSSFYFSLPV